MHWVQEFKKGNMVVYCCTREEERELIKYLDKYDVRWSTGESLLEEDFSDIGTHPKGFRYSTDDEIGLVHSPLEFYEQFYKDEMRIVRFYDINKTIISSKELYNGILIIE